MSSATTGNRATRSSTSRGRGGRSGTTGVTSTGGGSGGRSQQTPQQITITVMYHEDLDQITVDESSPVKELAEMIEARFGIPIDRQFIYGWPGAEPRDHNVLIKDLKLPDPDNVILNVARNGFDEGENLALDEQRPGSSRDFYSQAGSSQSSLINEIYQLSVFNLKIDQQYDRLPVDGNLTVREVKNTYSMISEIPAEHQEWAGWPKDTADNSVLKYLGLDKPFHSLALADARSREQSDSLAPPTSQSSTSSLSESTQKFRMCLHTGENRRHCNCNNETASQNLQSSAETSETSAAATSNPGQNSGENSSSTAKSQSHISVSLESQQQRGEKRKRETAEFTTSMDSPQTQSFSQKKTRPMPNILLRLPEDKVVPLLLKYLDPISQLSLRRVCKTTKDWISGQEVSFHEEEKWKKFRFVVTGEGYKSFETIRNMGLPVTRFVFDVKSEAFYETEDVDSFRSFFGMRIKDLTLNTFYMFQNQHEREMFESFHRLEKLTLQKLVVNDRGFQCPRILASLQVLKLNYEVEVPMNNALVKPLSWSSTFGLLMDCSSLLYLRYPKMIENSLNPMTHKDGIFAPLMEYISMKEKDKMLGLAWLDMKNFNDPDSSYACRFVDLLRRCYARDIKLANIHSLVVQNVFDDTKEFSDLSYKFCENIVSLINYSPFVENAPLSNLEKITVDVIPSVNVYQTLGKGYKDIFWPKLRVLKVKDTVQMDKNTTMWRNWQQLQEDLYGLNKQFDRDKVTYIKIDSPKLPYFLGEGKLGRTFINLTRLEITSWCIEEDQSAMYKRLTPLWKKLQRLEELTILNCPMLNDYTFIGPPDHDPAFVRLSPTFKKLTLGLDGVENVTDESLIKVFSKMKMCEFIILSSTPVNTITERGLLKLLNGEFGKHIEYFPFHTWSSSRIDKERFRRLGNKFRSRR